MPDSAAILALLLGIYILDILRDLAQKSHNSFIALKNECLPP